MTKGFRIPAPKLKCALPSLIWNRGCAPCTAQCLSERCPGAAALSRSPWSSELGYRCAGPISEHVTCVNSWRPPNSLRGRCSQNRDTEGSGGASRSHSLFNWQHGGWNPSVGLGPSVLLGPALPLKAKGLVQWAGGRLLGSKGERTGGTGGPEGHRLSAQAFQCVLHPSVLRWLPIYVFIFILLLLSID